MKNLNLIERLLSDSHEKQSPQRFARYAAILIMLLTLGVGQMWATWYVPGTLPGCNWTVNSSSNQMSSRTKTFSAVAKGTYDFQLTNGSNWSGNSCLSSITGPLYGKGTNGSNAQFKVAIVCDVTLYVSDESNWKVTATGKWNSSTTYYVAGDNALVGANWSVNSTKGKFVSSKVTFTGVEAGTYSFKITDGSNWSADNVDLVTSISGTVTGHSTSNNNMTITVSQKSDITFTQGDNGSLTVSGIAYRYIAGDSWGGMGEWSTTSTPMTYNSGTGVYSKTFNDVTAEDHKFKITYYDTWTDAVGYSANVSCVNGTVVGDGGNIKFTPYAEGDVTITYNGTNTVITCTAPTVTFDKEGGEGGVDSQSTPYNTTTSNVTTPSKTGYTFGGYYDGDDGTGNQIINASGVWQKNKTNFTDNSSTPKWIVTSNQTLHAKWTEKTYSLTFSCTNGTIKVGGSSVASGSTASVNHFTTKTLVATPSSGYRFVNWTLSGTNTNKVTIGDVDAASTTIIATATGATVTANFAALPNGQLDIVAGANGTVKKESGSWGSSASYTDINDDSDLNIYAKANTGYHFVNWTKSGDGSIKTNAATGVYTLPGRGSATVTANFAETKHNVTVQYKCGETTIKSSTIASNVGEVTTSNVSAPAISGYTFSSWTVGSGVTATTSTSSTPITIKTKSSGTYTITANYTEDLSTPYVIKGGTAITGSNWTVDIPFTKKSGESTGTVAYAEIPISATVVTDVANTNYNLKVYNNSNSHWVGLNEGSGDWWYYSNSGEKTLTDNAGNNIQLRANVVGTYIVKLDYTTASSPKITITWPVALSIYRSNPTDGTNIGDHAWNSMPTSTSYRWDIDLEANTTYEFKFNDKGTYYGHATLINTSFSDRTFATGTVDTKLQTKSAGRFVITYNSSNHKVSVVYPKSAVIGASPASVYTGGTTTLTGYASELGSGSHTITYEFYKGTTLTDAYKVGTETNTVDATYQQASHNVTVDFDGNAMSQVYTVQIKEGGVVLGTNTVTVYRKWDIYVHDVDSWNAMYYYVYDNASGDHREDWPGLNYSSNKITGSTTWYIVTLDAQYPHFILDNNAGNKQTWGSGVSENDITDFAAGSYWYVEYKETTAGKRYYDLHTIEVTDPTVTLSASVASCKNITLTGTVTDCGGDGMFASDMIEVYFQVAGTKNAATTTSSTDGTFTKTISNATAGATNTLQAFAQNVHGTGSSSTLHYTNVTLNRQGGTTGTEAVTAVENMAMPAGATAPGRTGYTFGGYYAYSGGVGKKYYNVDMTNANNWDQTSKDVTIHAKWTAKTYDVILDVNGGSGDNQTVTATYAADMPTTLKGGSTPIATRTRTGYNFDGYWANMNGTGTQYYTTGLSSNHVWDVDNNEQHIYAKWTPKTCTVTFDYQSGAEGYAGAGTLSNVTATYDAAMPALTGNMPTAAQGYAFMGFYSETGGNGTLYYNPNKTSAHNWDVDTESTTTLYAYYKKAEITEITLNATAFEPVAAGDEGYVVANPTIDPTPTGTTSICWKLLYDNDNPVPGHDVIDDHDGSHPNRVKFSIAGLAAGGYKVQATLYTGDGDCGSGTTLSVQEASFTIASNFTVTILYKCGDVTIKSSTTNPGKALEGTSITAPDIIGYTFSKWKAGDGVTIDGADASGEKATATITYTANYNGSLTAIYTRKRMIYFYNTLSWSNVYVYFYKNDSYWGNSNQGSGANTTYTFTGTPYSEGLHGQMLPIEEGSSIYYFDAEAAGVNASYTNVVFTELEQHGCNYFYNNNKVVRRSDYKSTTLPMFVPSTQTPEDKNGNTAKYYNKGYWMNYPENTGYTLRIYDTWGADNATGASREYLIPYSSDKKMPLTQDVEINFSGKTWFLIYRNDGNYLAGSHTFKQTEHNDYAMSSTDNAGTASKMTLLSDGEGIYTFNLSYHGDGANPENFHYYINVDFPAAVGDYRIVYKDNAEWSQGSAHTSSWYHPSKVIPKIKGDATEAKKDTVSFFVAKGDGITATMKFQYISAINASTGAVTWADVASGSITIPSSITTSGVYNFIVTQPVGGGSISVESAEPYTGNYYIRTDNAGDTKWNNYRSRDHQMVYTEFSRNRATNTFGELYTHYFTSWCERKTNIKFCIANDYSPCISDTLGQDVGNPYSNTDTGGNLNTDGATLPINDKYSANVRFMYNETTNKICRAYIGSSTNPARKFLMLEGNEVLKGDDDEAITDWDPRYALILADKQNWIYEHTLKIKPKTRFKLYACYAQTTVSPDGAQYFRGAYDSNNFTTDANSVILIDGAGDADYQMARIIYDFKTNRLMTAWIPSGSNVSGNMEINADVLVEREHQEPAQYITFANASSQLSGVKTVYGAMKFNRWILNNRQHSEDQRTDHAGTAEQIATHHAPLPVGQQKSIYERSLYFISFPFDVNANEIFGFGHYWDEWYLEYYDGLNRAKNGYWEDSPPNWKYVTPSMLNDFVLKANEGYILGLDLDFMKADNFDFWSNGISTVELFFPSTTTQGTLQQTNCTIPALGDEYRCKIDRGTTEGNRTIKDSYWRCLGVPSFNIYNTLLKDASGTAITWQPDGDELPFIYAWNKADNTLTAQSTSTFTFLPMHAYLVQNGGEIRWENVSAKPASPIVARRVNEQPATEYEWRLALTSDSVLIDQTYVKMSNIEQVTDTFDFNQDMIKEFNAYRSDIYTYIGYERVAANSMPLQTEQTTVIPVGVKIKTAGEYTFAMPDGTNGVGVTLVDTQTGVRTNLGLMDYTVTLTAGSFNQRFVLEISPIMQTPTDIEEVTGDGLQVTGVRKVLIDQKMYIIKDGKVYDARGAKVK